MRPPGDITNGAATALLESNEEQAASAASSLIVEPVSHSGRPDSELATRPEWQLAVRVASSRQLAKSDLLQRFLLGVCQMALEGRTDEITEHRIGTAIFQRPATYNPGEDNIVRSYARMLRRRLDAYFANEGASESMRVTIPRGGYVPIFETVAAVRSATAVPLESTSYPPESLKPLPSGEVRAPAPTKDKQHPTAALLARSFGLLVRPWVYLVSGLGAGLTIAVLVLVLFPTGWRPNAPQCVSAAHPIWAQIFNTERNTLIVPADAGLGILQNITGHEVTLTEYANGDYRSGPGVVTGINPSSLNDLRRQRYTSVADLDIVARLTRLPEYLPSRTQVRFARNITAEDFKSANVVLLGSRHSNPWVELFDSRVSFRFRYGPAVDQSSIINLHPKPGEQPRYSNEDADVTGRTFGTVVWLPSLDGQGHVLIIQGLNMAATQAAAELLFNSSQLGPILERAKLPSGALRPFELLIETSSIGATGPTAQIIASRIDSP